LGQDTDPVVYQIKINGQINTEQTINRFFYCGATTLVDITTLVDAFHTEFDASLLPATNVNWRWNSTDIEGVKGSLAFATVSRSVAGTTSGEVLPPYASWDFTLVRGGVGERNGYKRFAGVPESLQNAGIAVSGALPGLALVSASLEANLTAETIVFRPVIRRTRIHKVPVFPPQYWSIGGATYSKIGTQNSRKYGHGR